MRWVVSIKPVSCLVHLWVPVLVVGEEAVVAAGGRWSVLMQKGLNGRENKEFRERWMDKLRRLLVVEVGVEAVDVLILEPLHRILFSRLLDSCFVIWHGVLV
jgi:hypothetical protein